jgi:TetR/AcrR family transcriptional repressor of nem operon
MARPTGRDIRDEVIRAGQALAQSHGVAQFSYADIADRVGIRSASIHHHFPKKEDLVAAMAKSYRQDFSANLQELDGRSTSTAKLGGYRDLFARVVADGRLCLCGSAAAEWSSIGKASQLEVMMFFDEQREWLSDVVAAGVASGEFDSTVDADTEAIVILSALEGAVLLARAGVTIPELADIQGRLIEAL